MKKFIALLLIAVLALSLVACGAPAQEEKSDIKAEDIVGTWVLGSTQQVFNADGTGTVTLTSGIKMAADWTFKNGKFIVGYATGEVEATITKNEDGSLVLHYNGGDYTKQ